MGKDFFDGLGTAISRTARELGGKAENLYESQKMKNRIAGEERQIQKIMAEIGRIIYKRYLDGAPLEDAQKILCEQIDQRMDKSPIIKRGLRESEAAKSVLPAEAAWKGTPPSVLTAERPVLSAKRKRMRATL